MIIQIVSTLGLTILTLLFARRARRLDVANQKLTTACFLYSDELKALRPLLPQRPWLAEGEGTKDSHTYRHYKGGLYTLLFIAQTHEHTDDLDAVYLSWTTANVTTRPYRRDSRDQDSWKDMVMWPDGQHRPRFCDDPLVVATMPAASTAP